MTVNDLELRISKLLRTGVIVSGIIIAIGWIWGVAVNGADLFHYQEYHQISLVESIQQCLSKGNFSSLVVYFGLSILVLLPAARVLLVGILFVVQKEKILGWIAITVFVVLMTSFLLGTSL